MKIPLNYSQDQARSGRAAKAKIVEHDVLAAKGGDWSAKTRLAQTFMPLIKSLAEKRASDAQGINELIEQGKQGLYKAAKKYKKSIGADKFQIFALKYIEQSMDNKGGFFSKLFG